MLALVLSSAAFLHEHAIPMENTCEGANMSPSLAWSGVPPKTQSLALVMVDPDAPDPSAPEHTWIHWVLYSIAPDSHGVPNHLIPGKLPHGARFGLNDWHHADYGGPCPRIGKHRYYITLYALDTRIDLPEASFNTLQEVMHGHILGEAHLMGTYQKQTGRVPPS